MAKITDVNETPTFQAELEKQLILFRDALRSHQNELRSSYDVSAMEMEIILYIDKQGPQKMKQIGEIFGVKFSTLTSLVDKIEENNLVKRASSKDDRRSILVTVTKKGKKLIEDYDMQVQLFANKLAHLDEDTKNHFMSVLQSLTNSES